MQVFYIPTTAGGFIEIVDGGADAGVCTVASISANTVAGMLSLRMAPSGAGTPAGDAPEGADDAAAGGRGDGQGRQDAVCTSGREAGGRGRPLVFGDSDSAAILDGCGAVARVCRDRHIDSCPHNACIRCMLYVGEHVQTAPTGWTGEAKGLARVPRWLAIGAEGCMFWLLHANPSAMMMMMCLDATCDFWEGRECVTTVLSLHVHVPHQRWHAYDPAMG